MWVFSSSKISGYKQAFTVIASHKNTSGVEIKRIILKPKSILYLSILANKLNIITYKINYIQPLEVWRRR
jgi:hypothetical protein